MGVRNEWDGGERRFLYLSIILSSNMTCHLHTYSQTLKYKLGVVSTGNSLDHVEADDAQMAANGKYIQMSMCVRGYEQLRDIILVSIV